MKSFVLLFFVACAIHYTNGQLLEGIYCGTENCYDVLGVNRTSTKSEIARSYRRLARQFHPDSHKEDEAKKEAEEQFKVIATAYEILKDDEERTDYNYMLDNPSEYYAHYYRYYRRRVAPKVDVKLVIAIAITIISAVQYYSAWQRYESAIKYFMTVPKYRNQAIEVAKYEVEEPQPKKKGSKKASKLEQKEELERLIRKVIEEKMDIQGSYAKPSYVDILWVQLILLPYTLVLYITWYCKWIWKFTILKQPYGEEEKLYIIRKNLSMGVHQFNALEDKVKEEYLSEELWIKDNFVEWKEEQDEIQKKSLAENSKYKQYRRYMKQHGPGRMTFDDS